MSSAPRIHQFEPRKVPSSETPWSLVGKIPEKSYKTPKLGLEATLQKKASVYFETDLYYFKIVEVRTPVRAFAKTVWWKQELNKKNTVEV